MKAILTRIGALCLSLLVCYMVLTPVGALKTAVLFGSDTPLRSFFLQAKKATAAEVGLSKLDNPKHTTIYRIVSAAPHANATDTDMYHWIVSKHGIFYTANYYGWC